MSNVIRAALAGGVFVLGAGAALASDSRLDLVIGGEAYDGVPRFSVSFDGTEIGTAAVTDAIDTVETGTFADATDKAAYIQQISFDIPESVFRPDGEVRIRMLNEAWGGEGSTHDRNLYLASVSINGRGVTLSGLETRSTRDASENEVLGEFLVLRDGNVEAVTRPPANGWPLPGQIDAEVAAVSPDEAAADEAPPDVANVTEQDASGPEPVATETLAAVSPDREAAEAAEDATIETASIATDTPAPVAGTACTRDELYNVVGFNENSNDLTPKLMDRLDQVIADIGAQKCKLTVTGYSSKHGDHATNALFAIERAQNVLAYLRQNDVPFDRATATGGGATEQFGDSFAANRRVVITVAP